MMEQANLRALRLSAARCRRKVVQMIAAGGAGHVGGAMSCLDIVTALYFHVMNIDPKNPQLPERDRFILSAGHKCMAQYAVLCERGFFDESMLDTYGSLHTKLPGHPDMHKLPGIEANTGALGHGLSIAVGMAMGIRLRGWNSRVFAVMGDGELAEGSNWEAAAAASHHKLHNLTVFVDDNGLQIAGETRKIMSFEPIAERFKAFGWETVDIDGNDLAAIIDVADRLPLKQDKPSLVVAHTIKGKGISFLESTVGCHYWKPAKADIDRAIAELDAAIEEARR